MYEIMDKQQLCENIVLMEIKAPLIAKKAQPGQFIIFRIDEKGERVPLTINDYDRDKGTITIVFQKIGASTKRLNHLNIGDSILDITGPLGKPSEFESCKNVAVIGGGLGCAISYPQAKKLSSMGVNVDIIAGFRNKDYIILEDKMKAVCRDLIIMTDDGSNGHKGLVTDALKAEIEKGKNYDLVIAIGPLIMMKFVSLLTREYGIKTIVSMNTIMIDGTGMCGCCRLTYDGKVKFACVDGPDFDGHKVDFDEAMRRNSVFKKLEREQDCRLMGVTNNDK